MQHSHTPSSHPTAGLEVPCPHGVPLSLSLVQREESSRRGDGRGGWSGWGLLALRCPLVQGQGSPGHPLPPRPVGDNCRKRCWRGL